MHIAIQSRRRCCLPSLAAATLAAATLAALALAAAALAALAFAACDAAAAAPWNHGSAGLKGYFYISGTSGYNRLLFRLLF